MEALKELSNNLYLLKDNLILNLTANKYKFAIGENEFNIDVKVNGLVFQNAVETAVVSTVKTFFKKNSFKHEYNFKYNHDKQIISFTLKSFHFFKLEKIIEAKDTESLVKFLRDRDEAEFLDSVYNNINFLGSNDDNDNEIVYHLNIFGETLFLSIREDYDKYIANIVDKPSNFELNVYQFTKDYLKNWLKTYGIRTWTK